MSTPEKESKPSTYQILLSVDGTNWKLVGVSTGHGQETAVKKFLAEMNGGPPDDRTQYLAVPSRSWHPQVVRRETKVVATLVAASAPQEEPVTEAFTATLGAAA